VGLLGPNGAGKTTLLATLLGFHRPHAGTARILGRDITADRDALKSRLGYMPESDAYIAHLTAVRFVRMMAELSGLPPKAALERTHETLFYVGLGEARYRKLETYSLGMKQLAKLAQAIAHGPEVVFLDEPTNGLDPAGREEMLALIRDISMRRQMSLILCSHLLHDVEQVCEDVLVFNQGKVAARGKIRDLTGPRRAVYDVRVKGDASAFLTDLKDQGCEWREGEDGYRVFVQNGAGPELIFRTARDSGVQVRHLRPGAESLEDVFLRALGHEVQD
jgi:ABC-2 type transport system ATP-binding protein